MTGLGTPMHALARSFLGTSQRGAKHHGIGTKRERLDEAAGVAHAAIGDHLDVTAAGFVHVVTACFRHICDGGGHRSVDTDGVAVRGYRAATEADKHAGRAGTHQMQSRGIVGGATDDDGHIQIVDELLQVQRLVILGDMLGGNNRATDDEQVDARFEHGRIIVLRALRGQCARNGDAGIANLMQTLDNELRLDRLGVDLLNALGRAFGRQLGDFVEQRPRIVVAGPQAFDVPVIGAPMDSVTSPATAIAMGKMGALGVLDLEGLWTRYEDPTPLLDEIAGLPADQATERIQQIYAEPVKPELITQRLHEIRAAGVTVAGALSPQRTQQFYSTVVDAGVDLFVIRGTVVSAEHVSSGQEPLNLKKFIYDLDVPVIVGGASNYTAALHLMRTGAAGVLVGFGGGAVSATRQTIGVQAPMATAIADVAEARRDYMDESGGRYVQVIADGGMGDSGSFVKALALGADAVMLGAPLARATEAPGKGTHWGSEARHQTLPRGYRTTVGTVGPLEQVLFGPSHQADGKTNFIGALKRAMASTGYVDVKNFQRCGMVVNPYSAR